MPTTTDNGIEVRILPLVPNLVMPTPAPATTRAEIPPGYGVQEQCLPFTSATALGFLIGSPISFGFCLESEIPAGGHGFQSPLESSDADKESEDDRIFYVKDDLQCNFEMNGFKLDALDIPDSGRKRPVQMRQPGLSFFDRYDQGDLFKLHLPYIWRTQPGVDSLFLPLINHPTVRLTVLCGLVETDWYTHPVNLVCRKPPYGQSLHIEAGDPVAQVVFVTRALRRPVLTILPSHARAARDLRAALSEWYRLHAEDRSAYKKLVRSHHGKV